MISIWSTAREGRTEKAESSILPRQVDSIVLEPFRPNSSLLLLPALPQQGKEKEVDRHARLRPAPQQEAVVAMSPSDLLESHLLKVAV